MVQPLTATFAADFSNFKDAVSRAEDSLKDLGVGASNVEKALTSMGNSLSGSKVVQQATVAAEAVELIGGTAKLTDKELERLGKTATEASQKLERMGLEVPPGIRNIAQAAKEAESNTNLLGKISDFIGPKLVAAFSVGAVTAWATKIVEAGSKIEDLSKKLDVSHEAIQRWGYAAELSGGTIEDVGGAITFMNKTLAGGSNSTVDALSRAGLEFDKIRQLSPEDAFDVITEAIRKIPDPMDQARIAAELFGKGAATILPAIKEGFREVGKEAAVMSDDVIASLDEAGDTWTRFSNKFVVASANIIALADDTDSIFQSLVLTVAKLHDNVSTGLVTSVPKLADVFRALPATAKPAAQALEEFNKEFDPIETKRKEDAAKAVEDHNKKLQGLADILTGKDIARKQVDLAAAIQLAGGTSKITAEQMRILGKQMDDVVLAGGHLNPQLTDIHNRYLLINGVLPQVSLGMGQLGLATQNLVPTMITLNGQADHFQMFLTGFSTENLVKQTGNIIGALKESEGAWDATSQAAARADAEIEQRHQAFVNTIVGYSATLFNGLMQGWDGLKSAAIQVLKDILTYMVEVFVRQMLVQWGILAAASSIGGGAGAGSAAAGAGGAGAGLGAAGAIGAGAAFTWYFGNLINPGNMNTPTPPFTDLEIAQSAFDYVGPNGEAFLNFMALHPELWGQGRGFRGGTQGQYLDFGEGTPVMLHGKERVMTENEGWRQGGGVTIVVQTLDGADTATWLRRGGARQIADSLGPHLARVLA